LVTLPPAPATIDRRARLVATGDEDVSVAVLTAAAEGPAFGAIVRHATFAPWSRWPASGVLGPAYPKYNGAQIPQAFAISESGPGAFALSLGYDADHTDFAPLVAVESPGPALGTVLTAPGVGPAFVAHHDGVHLVGTRTVGALTVTRVQTGPGGYRLHPALFACSELGVDGDALPFADGFVVVTSNGQDNPPGRCASQLAGPPTRVDVVRLATNGDSSLVASLEAGGAVSALAAAAHPKGAWVVWRVGAGPLRYARVDVDASAVLGPGDLTGPADVPIGFAIAGLGSGLVVALGNDPAGNPPDVEVRLIDETGAPVGTAIFGNPPYAEGPTSVVASPAGLGVVVAWDAPDPLGVRAVLARVDCAMLD
jgi:hypothetical protein